MVAVTAAAIALDAFYASLKQRNGPHPDEAAWRQRLAAGVKPHPRHWQIAETLIGAWFAWSVRNPAAAELRRRVKRLFILRDLAVHPPADVNGFPLRKDINRRMEWRFSAYGTENARKAFESAEQLIEALPVSIQAG